MVFVQSFPCLCLYVVKIQFLIITTVIDIIDVTKQKTSPNPLHTVDTVAPVCVGVPSDVFENVELGIPSAVVSWTEPTCQDSDVAFLSDRSATSPSPFAVDQRTEVTFTCTDPTGNTGTCSFFVTVSSGKSR